MDDHERAMISADLERFGDQYERLTAQVEAMTADRLPGLLLRAQQAGLTVSDVARLARLSRRTIYRRGADAYPSGVD